MAHLHTPVHRDIKDVDQALLRAVATVENIIHGKSHTPEHPRPKNAGESPVEKCPCSGFHRQQEITGNHHKQTDTDAGQTIHPSYQVGVGIVGKAQIGPDVIKLTGMLEEH